MSIPKLPFGRTGHESTRLIFGAYALSEATQKEADEALELLLAYGVNHIDAARMYGEAEKWVGTWMKKHRDRFFLATKVFHRRFKSAWKNLKESLAVLEVEQIDLWQAHNLTSDVSRETAMEPGGSMDAMLEAREKGLVRFLGVTGHGTQAAAAHRKSLAQYDFESVLLPYNTMMMRNAGYAADFQALVELCRQRKTAVQTIKSVARRKWGKTTRSHHTFFYEPLTEPGAIQKAVHWAMGLEGSFVVSAGDLGLLKPMLEAADCFKEAPSEEEMAGLVKEYQLRRIFI